MKPLTKMNIVNQKYLYRFLTMVQNIDLKFKIMHFQIFDTEKSVVTLPIFNFFERKHQSMLGKIGIIIVIKIRNKKMI